MSIDVDRLLVGEVSVDFNLSEQEKMLQTMAKEFAAKSVQP